MKAVDLIQLCGTMVFRNRRRYRMVVIAIAVGTIGFVVVRTMGDSVEKKLSDNIELLGEATIVQLQWRNSLDNPHPGFFSAKDVAALKRIPNIAAVAPVLSIEKVTAFLGKSNPDLRVTAIDQYYWNTQQPQCQRGRLISASDVIGRNEVCVLGEEASKKLFGDGDPVGKTVVLEHMSVKVIGLLGGLQREEIKSTVFLPITVGRGKFPGLDMITEIYIRAENWDHVETVRNEALEVVRMLHPGQEEGIEALYHPARLQRVRVLVAVIQVFVYASLIVAFFLGKVGLTNAMMASVKERTREIGLRKAVGATEEVILSQFLLESVFVSMGAGALGIGGGILGVFLLQDVLGTNISHYVLSSSIVLDVVLTLAIGVFAGLYPSAQASRLDVVTAMRFE